jgi:hypothetical protein
MPLPTLLNVILTTAGLIVVTGLLLAAAYQQLTVYLANRPRQTVSRPTVSRVPVALAKTRRFHVRPFVIQTFV